MENKLVIRGKHIDSTDLKLINEIISTNWARGRTFISQKLCRFWDWRQANGTLKDQVCRILLSELEKKKLIVLPPRRGGSTKGKSRYYTVPDQLPNYPRNLLQGCLQDFGPVRLTMVRKTPQEVLWNYLVYRYHYKSYRIIVGEHLKYLVYLGDIPVACLSWCSTVFRIGCRDEFIGWQGTAKNQNIRYVANNSRFLILPWVCIKNLASHVLAKSARIISRDWQCFYNHQLILLETFVETDRFRGICYQAANWVNVGRTSGHAKEKGRFYYHGRKKDVYLYPLKRNYQRILSCNTQHEVEI